MWAVILVLTFFAISFLRYLTRSPYKKGFWKQYGIKEIDASNIVSDLDYLLSQKDITQRDDYVYNILGEDEKFCGMVENPIPVLLLKDLELIKRIYIKHFDHFVDRRQFFGAARKDSVLLKMLGNLQGEEWKSVRASVTATFTTGKIRRMMESINSVGAAWVEALNNSKIDNCNDDAERGFKINAYKCMSIFTADVIAAAIFGLQAEVVKNPESTFFKMANRLTNMNTFQNIKFGLSLAFPKVFRFFNIDFLDMEALHFFEDLLSHKLKERMNNDEEKGSRNDFLQILVEARKGLGSSESEELNDFEKEAKIETKKHAYLTNKIMRGQCLSFFFAGYRTSSTFLTFAIYALALHQDVQDKLREEIEAIRKKSGKVAYEDLGRLDCLEMFICEILRKFPATLRLERKCVSDFQDPETGLFIPKGTFVGVPLHAIHNDKRYYENPESFDPFGHFDAKVKAKRNQAAFIPFGIGPRNCIGMRFALLESKAALVYLIQNFVVEPTARTPSPLTGRRVNFQIIPPENLELRLVPINH